MGSITALRAIDSSRDTDSPSQANQLAVSERGPALLVEGHRGDQHLAHAATGFTQPGDRDIEWLFALAPPLQR